MMRTTTTTVMFKKPFFLSAFEQDLPAGVYRVETDEDSIEGLSFQAFRRTECRIHVPENLMGAGTSHTLIVAPDELDTALILDRSESSGQHDADNAAIARAEGEGMT